MNIEDFPSSSPLNESEAHLVANRLLQLQGDVHRGMSYIDVTMESLSPDDEYNRRQVLVDAYEILQQAAALLDLQLLRSPNAKEFERLGTGGES